MLKKIACWCLALACGLALGACARDAGTGGEGGGVDASLAEVRAFTDELLKRVEAAGDAASGAAEAQRYLEGRRAEIRSKIVSVRRGGAQGGEEAKRKLLECEVENTDRVARLRTRYMDEAMSDPAFKERLDRLVTDYQALFVE